MNNATEAMLRRGRLEEADLPGYFTDTCTKLPELICAVNSELKALLYRRQYKKRLKENQAAAFNQYADISTILSEYRRSSAAASISSPSMRSGSAST